MVPKIVDRLHYLNVARSLGDLWSVIKYNEYLVCLDPGIHKHKLSNYINCSTSLEVYFFFSSQHYHTHERFSLLFSGLLYSL